MFPVFQNVINQLNEITLWYIQNNLLRYLNQTILVFSMCLKYIILKTYDKIRWFVCIIIILSSLKVKENKILTRQVFHFI